MFSDLRFFSEKININNDKYLILPNKKYPRIIIPLKNFKLFINGLKVQNTASFKNRLIKNSLLLGYSFFKIIPFNIIYSNIELKKIIDITKKLLNDDEIFDVSVYIGTDKSKNRKLTFLLMDKNGSNLGILKYPIKKESVNFIENEYNSLNLLHKQNYTSFRFPIESKYFDFEYDKILYQENIFHHTRHLKNELNQIIVDAAVELAVRTNHNNLFNYFNGILEELKHYKGFNHLEERYKLDSKYIINLRFPLISTHGDFVLYNMQTDNKRLYLIDWEYFRDGLPLFDLFHFVFQGKYQIEKKRVYECIEAIFNNENIEFYKYYFNKMELNIKPSEVNKIIQKLFFVYLIDNLLFEQKIKTDLPIIDSHYYQALLYLNHD